MNFFAQGLAHRHVLFFLKIRYLQLHYLRGDAVAKIAVLNDNANSMASVSACLKQDGHEVLEIHPSCLYDVLAVLHESPVDLLLTDLLIPGSPGLTLLRACREDIHLKHLKILLLTAFGDQKVARFLQSHGNIHYLSKPISPEELVECVNLYLGDDLTVDPGWSLSCRGTVAVVDDSHLCRCFHANHLRRNGFRPLEIPPDDLTSVLNILKETRPNMLLLDFLMPKFRGDALIRAIRASDIQDLREMPVLLVTAHYPEDPSGLIFYGEGVEILFKPVGPGQLIAKVEAMVQAPRQDH